MPGYSIEEFRVVPCHHFLFSALCFAGFAVGYLHTRETNLEGRFPYFVFGAVLGGIHFILMLVASTFNDQAKTKEKWISAPKTIGFYRFLVFCNFIYCIAGAVLTGQLGFCQRGEYNNETTTTATTTTTTSTTTTTNMYTSTTEKPEEGDEPCYFYENYEVNLAMSICIVALHAFSFLYGIFIISKSGKTEQKAKALAVEAAPKPPPAPKPQPAAATTNPQPKPSTKEDTSQNKAKATTHIVKTTKVSPAKKKTAKTNKPKVTSDKMAPKTTVTSNIVVNITGSDMNRIDNYTYQTLEEDTLRLLQLQQAQEASRNGQFGAYLEGFDDDDRAYTPSYPPPPIPPPPSYETVMAGAYPAADPLEAVVLEPDPSEMLPWTPGPEFEMPQEYNFSHRPNQLTTDLRPPPVVSPNNLNSNCYVDNNV